MHKEGILSMVKKRLDKLEKVKWWDIVDEVAALEELEDEKGCCFSASELKKLREELTSTYIGGE